MPGRVVVEVEVRPTEERGLVEKAVLNLFGEGGRFEEEPAPGGGVLLRYVCEGLGCLTVMHRLLRRQRILDTARSLLSRGRGEGVIVFMLNKQAALAGRVSFVSDPGESPLGPIRVSVYYERPGEVIDWLAPRTSRGRPLWERGMPG